MSLAHQSARGTVEAAVHTLATELAGALRHTGGGGFSLRTCADVIDEPVGALGAVRGLGGDALAPFLLAGHALTSDDSALVREAVGAYPAPPSDAADGALWAARDAALVRVLAALGVRAEGWDGLAAGHLGPTPGEGPAPQPVTGEWPLLAAGLARLSSLALPPVESAERERARERRTDLDRGLVRALLRRDHLTAARLTRWLALDAGPDPDPLLRTALGHIAALTPDQPRVQLELAVARRLSKEGAA
ncbi:hypothetical protein [Streptomyces sp. SBT349]|uniref:hypothetical protein n=1 Tax=Streptomyces sp. SBT349 TaxID=1580539 RepID=UPI00066CD851|nr:hypothetical protein [Streptomyces sp. SBT349]